jgi:alkyldihydroxyacetonephosphate synthase
VDAAMKRALELCAAHGGDRAPGRTRSSAQGGVPGGGAVAAWREAFLGAPYMRDVLIAMGVLSETFETAITWDRFPAFNERVSAAAEEAIREVCGEGGLLTRRFTHVYADGPAVYYTVLAQATRGEEIAQWQAIKRAASDAIIAEGGTITHHHAVGREHRPWYELQRPDPFAEALRGAKAAVDPAAIMNPGVLLDPALSRTPALG